MRIPKECPTCGAAAEDNFVADYYEAVYQGIIVGKDGGVHDYNGITGNYDDGSTETDCIRCRECGESVVVFGRFEFIETGVWTIFGLYEDNGQRYADIFEAKTATGAVAKAPDGLIVAAVVEGRHIPNLSWEDE